MSDTLDEENQTLVEENPNTFNILTDGVKTGPLASPLANLLVIVGAAGALYAPAEVM